MKQSDPKIIVGFLLLASLVAVGCEMERRVVKSSAWDTMFSQSEWYDGPAAGSDGSEATNRHNRGYAVELARYSGAEAYHNLQNIMRTARQEAGLSNLWYSTVGRTTAVYMGRFKDDDSREAKAALKLAATAEVDGEKMFADAKIVKLGGGRDQVLDPRDIRSLKGRGLFALQIGYYDGGYGPDFRRAAETAVDVLRDQEQEAYYYHGPNRSMVLLNSWTYNEAFTRQGSVDRYSNAVRLTQEQHPYNVPNGRAFKLDDDPEYVQSQHSFLVPIR